SSISRKGKPATCCPHTKACALPFNRIPMKEHKTDRAQLIKGIKTLAGCLALMFLGPTMLYLAFSNQDKPTYLLVLGIAVVVCMLAVFFLFRGISIVMKSLFGD